MDQRLQRKLHNDVIESFQRQVDFQDKDPAEVPIEARVVVLSQGTMRQVRELLHSGMWGLTEEEVIEGLAQYALRIPVVKLSDEELAAGLTRSRSAKLPRRA